MKRDVQHFPSFSWSFSRASTFSSCERQYYYAYYGSHNGWLVWRDDIADETKLTYRLKKLVSLPILFGQIVHDLIEKSTQQWFVSRYEPTIAELEHLTRDHLNEAFKDAVYRQHNWLERPAQYTMLYDIYYEGRLKQEDVQMYSERIRPTWENFLQSETWQAILSRPDDFHFEQIEDFASFMLEHVRVWAVLDLLFYDRRAQLWYIVDWKTGNPSDADRQQLVLYAYYVAQQYGIPIDTIQLRNEYLKTGQTVTFTASERDLQQMFHVFRHSVDDMRAHLVDPMTNEPKAMETFPLTNDKRQCYTCNYKEICPSLQEK